MECPRASDWYELERGTADRETAERLRRHAAECDECRERAGGYRDVAAALELLAARTRADLPAAAEESIRRRARVHGLMGRPLKHPLTLRLQRRRGLKRMLKPLVGLAAAAALVMAIGIHFGRQATVTPNGALALLAPKVARARSVEDLRQLAPLAQAAVAEEIARPDASAGQVSDLLMVTYITQRPREARQARDAAFLAKGVLARRPAAPVALAGTGAAMLASIVPAPGLGARSIDQARQLLLAGRYEAALAAAPKDNEGRLIRAWCLQALGRESEAAEALGDGEGAAERSLAAHLAVKGNDVAEAMRQYELAAAGDSRYWFASGYFAQYEQGDLRGAGLRYQKVRDPRLAGFVAAEFKTALAAAGRAPEPWVLETFDAYELGPVTDWMTLVHTRGGEFRVTDVAGNRVLDQNEVDLEGAELLIGGPAWQNYTVQFDFRVIDAPTGDYTVGASAYRRDDHTGYVLELSPHRLRLVKQFAMAPEGDSPRHRPERLDITPARAQRRLDTLPAVGRWYTMKLRVQQLEDGQVSVAGKFWRTGEAEPLDWEVAWTDAGSAGAPLEGGFTGIQLTGARALLDNFIVTRNETAE